MPKENQETRAVYTIVKQGDGKNHWLRIGVAFTNRDGSINVVLNALPMNGKLQLRDWPEQADQQVLTEEVADAVPEPAA